MSYYPLFLDVAGKRCVVVGGGTVACRKVGSLLEHGAQVTVISPQFCPEMETLAAEGKIIAQRCEFRSGDLEGAFVVIAATDDMAVNREVAVEAEQGGILINVVDVPALSNFIVPSSLRRGDLTLAISTSGKSPALARKLRTVMEQQFGAEYAELTALLDEVRCELKDREVTASPDLWQQAIDLKTLLEMLCSGRRVQAKEKLLKSLTGGTK